MDKPITVSYRWTRDEFRRVQDLKMRYSKFRRVCLIGGSLCIISGMGGLFRGGAFVVPGVPLAIIGFLALTSLAKPRRHLDNYDEQPDHNRLVTFEISANIIALRSEVTSSEALWRGIVRAYRTRKGFLLYQTDRETHWLPVSGFQDSADIERLAEMLKSSAKEYNDVR